MDAAFWDLSTPSPLTLDGVARSIPGDALPLRTSPSCLALRPQQLSFFRNAFPLGLVPSFSPSEIGSFAIQSLLAGFATSNWCVDCVIRLFVIPLPPVCSMLFSFPF